MAGGTIVHASLVHFQLMIGYEPHRRQYSTPELYIIICITSVVGIGKHTTFRKISGGWKSMGLNHRG